MMVVPATFARRGATLPRVAMAFIIAGMAATTSLAQSTQPAGRFEDQPVRVDREAKTPAPTTNRSSAATNVVPPVRLDWQRVALALVIVLALIALLRFVGKR